MNESARTLWARGIVRNHRRSTAFLMLFVAVAATASMTAWQYSRRADTVIDRRVGRFQPADGVLNSCPPGADPSVDTTPCVADESNEFAYRTLVESRFVTAAVLTRDTLINMSVTEKGAPVVAFSSATMVHSASIGTPNVVAGRMFDEQADNELMISETMAHLAGIGVGSTVWATPCSGDAAAGAPDCGQPSPLEVVGVTRTDHDLLAAATPAPGQALGTDGQSFPGYAQPSFRLAPGATLEDVRADVQARLPQGWTVLVAPTEDVTTYDGLRQATRLQARALLAITVILMLAGCVFVGQALVRQIRRELADHQVATALGMTSSDIVAVASMRALPVVLGAGMIAAGATALLSALGPSGLAGRAEVRPGLRLDAVVLLVGVACIVGFVLLVVAISARGLHRRSTRHVHRMPPSAVSGALSPTANAGLVLGRSGRAGGIVRTAVLGTAAAIAGVTVAAVLVDSLRDVERTPADYGVSWQYAAEDGGTGQDTGAIVDQVANDGLVTDAALVSTSGPVQLPSIPAFWVVSYTTIKGELGPVIVEGRSPTADDEVAVAPSTLAALGNHIGDTIDSLPVLASGTAAATTEHGTIGPLRIVGEALISDNQRIVGPGKGMILTDAQRRRIDPAVSPVLLFRSDPSVSPVDTVRGLSQRYGRIVVPNPQFDLANLSSISNTPWIIALLVAALAAAALGHALVSLVRRSHREIGVLRALGFTRRQVQRAVCWQATLVAMVAIVVGIPVGVIAGRWGWRILAERVGVMHAPVVHVFVPVVAAAAWFVAANVIALAPGVRAGRRSVVESLRAE
jgi:hypothetical protein